MAKALSSRWFTNNVNYDLKTSSYQWYTFEMVKMLYTFHNVTSSRCCGIWASSGTSSVRIERGFVPCIICCCTQDMVPAVGSQSWLLRSLNPLISETSLSDESSFSLLHTVSFVSFWEGNAQLWFKKKKSSKWSEIQESYATESLPRVR